MEKMAPPRAPQHTHTSLHTEAAQGLTNESVADLGLAKGGFIAHSARENFRATPICALATPTLIKDAQLLILCIVLDRAQGLPIDQYSFSITRR